MIKIHRTSTLLASLAVVGFTANFVHAQEAPLPDFVKKVQFQNCGGLEPTEDGKGVRLYRVPKSVRDHLKENTNPDGSGKTGAEVMTAARHCEIRFVLKEGEKKENVKWQVNITFLLLLTLQVYYRTTIQSLWAVKSCRMTSQPAEWY